jgi:hypothetical protein
MSASPCLAEGNRDAFPCIPNVSLFSFIPLFMLIRYQIAYSTRKWREKRRGWRKRKRHLIHI